MHTECNIWKNEKSRIYTKHPTFPTFLINAIRQGLGTRSHFLTVCQLENVQPSVVGGFSYYGKIDCKKP
ncbi:hypothetical protein [Nostoc sp. DedQUE09]|uniref:hypothetical protein n=1 Tax=Nostoc sp. DedQUE09 TaxID=3075394 RepID=UPI002AD5AAD1|nr:hypothetical protein [Nostoc sp. DedQUE09]